MFLKRNILLKVNNPGALHVKTIKFRLFAMAKAYYGEKWWDDKSVAVVTGANKVGFCLPLWF
jgi:hypothetical protein